MNEYAAFRDLSPTTLADVLPPGQVLAAAIRPMWPGMPRLAGFAYTVRCGVGDSLMLHAAIYRAPPGAIVVVEAGDAEFALAGGNVCAVAKKHGILGFVVDGSIRDIAEIRAMRFPVFARGVIPVAAGKNAIGTLNTAVCCGGVVIRPRDVLVADEEGIVVIPAAALESTLQAAMRKATKESTDTLVAWEAEHRMRIERLLRDKGFAD